MSQTSPSRPSKFLTSVPGADLPDDDVEPEAPAPEPKAAAKPKAAPRPPKPAVVPTAIPMPALDYAMDPNEHRVKWFPMMSPSLLMNLDMVAAHWTLANPQWIQQNGTPDRSGIAEALIRLGIKHMRDDLEFADLIPPDRRKRRRELDADE